MKKKHISLIIYKILSNCGALCWSSLTSLARHIITPVLILLGFRAMQSNICATLGEPKTRDHISRICMRNKKKLYAMAHFR